MLRATRSNDVVEKRMWKRYTDSTGSFSQARFIPWKINGGFTYKMTHVERKMIFKTCMIMFHVNLPGCTPENLYPKPKKGSRIGSDRLPVPSIIFSAAIMKLFCGSRLVGLSPRLPGFQGQNEGLDWDPWILK